MIFITGDTHGEFFRFNTENFPEQNDMTRDDTVIIAGDFGGVWCNKDSGRWASQEWWLNWLESKPYTTAFIDGNHDNFPLIATYPIKEWNGGKVHEIRPHVLHLIRGEVYEIEGRKFFCFGGASSHDIKDGILDVKDINWKHKAKQLEKEGKFMFRVKGLSWWPEEIPSNAEMANGLMNLDKNNWKVDFVITHSPDSSMLALLGHGDYRPDVLSNYLSDIRAKLDYKKWFFGHMHVNVNMAGGKDIGIFEQIIRII